MKKVILATCAIVGLWLCAAGVGFAEDRTVIILNFSSETGDESVAAMAATAQGILSRGIRYIGEFEVVPAPSFKIGTDLASLREFANLTNCEYVIFGTLTPGKNGSVKIANDLYSRADDSISETVETAESALDVFSASDAISVKVLSELHKKKISYGTLTLATTGERADFDVYVNAFSPPRTYPRYRASPTVKNKYAWSPVPAETRVGCFLATPSSSSRTTQRPSR